jgi:hypothetical protein
MALIHTVSEKILNQLRSLAIVLHPLLSPKMSLWMSFEKITSKRCRAKAFGRPRVRMNVQVCQPLMDTQSARRTALANSREDGSGGRPILWQNAQPPYSQEHLILFIELIHWNISFRIIIVIPLLSYANPEI